MATKVELSTRTTRSDILNEAKPSRTYVSPLSDASNKSSDTSIFSSPIIEDTVRNTSKTVSMLNTGLRPRLSPKPFSREKPLESRWSVGMPSTLSVDVKQHSDVPFQATTSISLSGSTKSNESERVGRRIITSPPQASNDDDQGNKSEGFSLTAAGRRQTSPSWPPGTNTISESKSTPTDERKVTSKPPVVSRKPELSQQEKVYSSYSRKTLSDLVDEPREPGDKSLEKTKPQNIDSLTVRAQLRQKRRPVSAVFLESNDPVSDQKVADEPIKRWNRRPLSEDLTSLFEMRGVENKKESQSDESKENIPFRKNSLSSIADEQSNVSDREGDYASDKNLSSDTRMGVSGITLRNTYSAHMTKEKTKDIPSNKQQQIADVGENEGVMKLSANMNQSSKFLLDQYDGSSGEVKKSDESAIVSGIMKRRIGLYTANTSSSEEAKVPSNTEDKNAANTERKTRNLVSEKETKSGTEWITSQSPTASTDFTKKFFNSPSKLDWKAERPNEERRSSFSSQDYTAQKAKKDWQNTSRTNDEPVQYKEDAEFSKDKKDYSNRDKFYDAKTNYFEETNKSSAQVEKTVKTVKASMFEHNIERHSPPEVYHSGNLMPSQPPRSDITSERLQAKHQSSSWSEWLRCDNVQSVSPFRKDLEIKDCAVNEKSVGIVSTSTEDGNVQRMMLVTPKTFDENRRVEAKYEVVQAVTERVLSESIQIAPEDKAVTLRSRRSFHNKEWELGKDGDGRSGTSLQRSKSEYRKRNTLSSPLENSGRLFFRDTDFAFERKNALRTEKNQFPPSESLYKKERIFRNKNTSNENKDFDFKDKSHELDNKIEKQEGTLEKYSSGYSQFGSFATGKGEMKTSVRSFNQQSDKSISSRSSIEKDSEIGIKSLKEDPTIANLNLRNELNDLTQEYKNQPSFNQFHPQKGLSARNINKEESNYFTTAMLNTEIEEIKRELSKRRSSKEVDSFPKKDGREESKDPILLKSKDSFQDGGRISRTSEMYSDELDDIRKKTPEFRIPYEKKDHIDITAAKDPSPVDKKVTYFAVTGIDGKRQRNDDGENQISSNASFSEDFYFTHSLRTGRTNLNSNSEKNIEKPLDTSHVLKGSTTYKNVQVLQDNLKEKSEKASESHSVVDALLKRHKQKPIVDDKSPLYLDTQTNPMQKSRMIVPENKTESKPKESPLKLDGTYKSKAVDIDSLMADYNASQRKDQENKARDDDHNLTKWERSRSFREGVSKVSSNKWKDPSARNVTYDAGSKYEPAASQYTSPQETTSTKDDLKQVLSKSPTLLDNFSTFAGGNHESDPYKRRGVQGIRESSVKTISYKEHSTQSFDSMTTEARSASYLQDKQRIIQVSGDQNENPVADREHQGSTHRQTNPEEKTQSLSEGKKTAKASDLIGLMLENREKRMERYRSGQNVPVDLPQEAKMHRESRQEWTFSETKEYRKKEELKQQPTRIREIEVATDVFRRKSINRHTEYTTSSTEDHVKQCFSRSSTSNKDTDSLVQETDRQYGTWSQDKQQPEESFAQESYEINSRKRQSHSRLSSLSHTETDQHDSIAEARDGSLDRSSMDLDSTDGTASTPSFHEAKAADFSFMDQTSVLDSTALKNRVQLSRKSQRRAPSQSQRRSRLLVTSSQLAVIEDTDSPWMFTDSTEPEPEKKEEVEEEEEKPQRSSLPSQRMPMFPGMDHSSLMAQLRKRQEADSGSESSTQPSSPQASAQPSRSPKSPLPQGTLGVKLLPTSADIQDRGASASPQWLKELKSKKRQSQYENHS